MQQGGGPERIATRGDGYVLELRDGDEVDSVRFDERLDDASAALTEDPQQSLELVEDALASWRGRAFGDLADAVAVRAEAVRLEERHTWAHDLRVEALRALDRTGDVIGELEASITERPPDERPVNQLMRALHRQGRQADALAVFRANRERTVTELGTEPSADLAEVHEGVLRHAPQAPVPVGTAAGGIELGRVD